MSSHFIPPPRTLDREEWPPNYVAVWAWRQQTLLKMRSNPVLAAGAHHSYAQGAQGCVDFINHWVDTYDPRNAGRATPARMPFILFRRQDDMVRYVLGLIQNETNGLIEKCRDMGATWLAAAISVWLWRYYKGAAVGWGSRKEQLVDKIGDPDSIFEKIRMIIRGLPRDFHPVGFSETDHMPYMRIINPETDATITGEAGDNIGRGGRKLIYFKDESAHYERPEKIEAALADNTRVQIDISSVNGVGNVFHRRRESGVVWEGGEIVKDATNVFIMDWSDHPAKDMDWYLARKAKAIQEGLRHVFAQEVERNYSASVEGVMIKDEWIVAAIDADKKLKLPRQTGKLVAGLDVYDGGRDGNALAVRRSYKLLDVEEWKTGDDVGKTTRLAVSKLRELYESVELQYDCVGIGAGVKAEANRLTENRNRDDLPESEKMPKGIELVAWSAGAGPQRPDGHLIPWDRQSPRNKDFFANLKAQGWWMLARRFEKTYNAVTEGVEYPPEELISLPSTLPKLQQLRKELTQVTAGRTASALKLVVNKAPEGTSSPNLADAVMEAYWPILDKGYSYNLMAAT